MQVADKNNDKRITIDDFRKILDCGEEGEDDEEEGAMQGQSQMMDDDMEGMDGEHDENDETDSDEERMWNRRIFASFIQINFLPVIP